MSSAPWPGFPSIVKTVKLRWYTLELCLGLVSLVLLAHFVLILFRELTVCVFLAVGAAIQHCIRGGAGALTHIIGYQMLMATNNFNTNKPL